MSQIFTAYITRYALSSGIMVIQAEEPSGQWPDMISNVARRSHTFHGKDWHRTPEAAIARAEEMRTKKVASMEKQIAKLRKVKFEVPA